LGGEVDEKLALFTLGEVHADPWSRRPVDERKSAASAAIRALGGANKGRWRHSFLITYWHDSQEDA